MSEVLEMAKTAKAASRELGQLSSSVRNGALIAMAQALEDRCDTILSANAADMSKAKEAGTSAPLLDRLLLTEERVVAMADALRNLAGQPDPIGDVVEGRTLYNDIRLTRVRVPLGVVAMIYEARPNVTADAAGLCIKTGNACILRGGSMAIESCLAISSVLAEAACSVGLPQGSIQSVESTDRSATDELMSLHGLVDVLIPRGSNGLISYCVANAKVPVIETGTGNCHTYIHAEADPSMIVPIILNAKTQRPGVCNACESILIDESVADALLPDVIRALSEAGVTIHADAKAAGIADGLGTTVMPGTQEDWGTEYLALEISIKCVSGLTEAIDHINTYGTGHSECILSLDARAIATFTEKVDAAAVYANASTRFTDGGEFGLGAEIGISTQKLHARGPMGLTALTSTKFILLGDGQIRD